MHARTRQLLRGFGHWLALCCGLIGLLFLALAVMQLLSLELGGGIGLPPLHPEAATPAESLAKLIWGLGLLLIAVVLARMVRDHQPAANE